MLCSQGGIKKAAGQSELKIFWDGGVSPRLNSPYVTAKKGSCLGATVAEKSEVRSFWVMQKPAVLKNKKGTSQSSGIPNEP